MDYQKAEYLGGMLFNPDHLVKLHGQTPFMRMGDHRQVWQCFLGCGPEALFMVNDLDDSLDGDYNCTYIISRHEHLPCGLYLEAHVAENFGSGSASYTAEITAEGDCSDWDLNTHEE